MRRFFVIAFGIAAVWLPLALSSPATAQTNSCDPAYPNNCIPSRSVASLNCRDLPYRDIRLANAATDPQSLDNGGVPGVGCELSSFGAATVNEAAFRAQYRLPGGTAPTSVLPPTTLLPPPTALVTTPPLPSALPLALPTTGASSATLPARTGRNEHLMLVAATIAIALGTAVITVTPRRGRHTKGYAA